MAGESRKRFMNLELAIQRELAYRRKIFLQSQEDDDIKKDMVPSELPPSRQSASPCRSSIASLPSSPSRLSGEKQQASNSTAEHLLPHRAKSSISHPMNAEIIFCKVCNVPCSGSYNYKQHMDGCKHKANLEILENDMVLSESLPSKQSASPSRSSIASLPSSPSRSSIASLPSSPSWLSGGKEQASTSSAEHLLPQQAQSSIGHPKNANQAEIFFCTMCDIPCFGSYNYKQHMDGRKHKAKLKELSFGRNNVARDNKAANKRRWWCEVCNTGCTSEGLFQLHLRGKRHKIELEKTNQASNGSKEMTEQKWCKLCDIWCPNEDAFRMHLEGKKHVIRVIDTEKKRKALKK